MKKEEIISCAADEKSKEQIKILLNYRTDRSSFKPVMSTSTLIIAETVKEAEKFLEKINNYEQEGKMSLIDSLNMAITSEDTVSEKSCTADCEDGFEGIDEFFSEGDEVCSDPDELFCFDTEESDEKPDVNIYGQKTLTITESELFEIIRSRDSVSRNGNLQNGNIPLIFGQYKGIVITEIISPDECDGISDYQKLKKMRSWIAKTFEKNITLCTTNERIREWKSALKEERKIVDVDNWLRGYEDCFKFKIRLKNWDEKEVFSWIINKLSASSYDIRESFLHGLCDYIYKTYPYSIVKNEAYSKDVYNLVVRNKYLYVPERKIIDEKCVPIFRNGANSKKNIEELEKLPGLYDLKKTLKQLSCFVKFDEKDVRDEAVNMIFSGNPGTGKTMAVKMTAKILCAMGLIQNDNVVSVSCDDLIGRYIGDLTEHVSYQCKRAYGGILLIDEAYNLNPKSASNNLQACRQEALTELMKEMEDNKDKLTVIFAGYPEEMEDFLNSNPGLKSRIYKTVEFADYTDAELVDIFKRMCDKRKISYDAGVLERVKERIAAEKCNDNFGNARTVRNIFDEALISLSQGGNNVARKLKPQHIVIENKLPDFNELKEKLDSLVGLGKVKNMVMEITDACRYNKLKGNKISPLGNMIFTGNAGTGKTTIARILGSMLYEIGAVRSPKFVEINGGELMSRYVGESGAMLKKYCNKAKGGVLFIDEVYTLLTDSTQGGNGTVSVLLDVMENYKDDLIVILAGYEDEMNRFLESNQGLSSRLPERIHFEDYNEDDLVEIFLKMCNEREYHVSDEGLEKIREVIKKEMKKDDFSNARSIRGVFEHVCRRHAVNYMKMKKHPEDEEEKITADDIKEEEYDKNEKMPIGFRY